MAICILNICLICAEIILYSFHFTVFLLLILQRNKKFKGAFYDIIRTIFIADFVFIVMQYQIRLPTFGLWPEFYQTHGYLASLILNINGYCVLLQFVAHTLIAVNRYTVFWFPTKYEKIWSRHWYILITVILPLIAISHRIFEPGIFQYNENGGVIVKYLNDSTRSITYYVTSTLFSTMTIIQALFNFLAVIKYYYFKKTHIYIDNKETQLLGLSCILFLIQWLRCAHNFGRLIFPNDENINLMLQTLLPIIADIYAWSGSLSLLLLSSSTRKAYKQMFLKCCCCFGFSSSIKDSYLQQRASQTRA